MQFIKKLEKIGKEYYKMREVKHKKSQCTKFSRIFAQLFLKEFIKYLLVDF